MRGVGAALGWAAIALLAGCERPRTELVVRVESELEWGPGRTVQSVVLTVRRGGHDGAVRSVRTTALGAPPERQALPLYVGVIPLDGDTDAPLWIEALGCGGPNGCAAAQAVVAQRAIVRFSPGETLELPLLLATACVGAACAVDQRCVEGGRCEVATRAQEAVRPFAGVPTPTGTDAGSTDAGPGVDGTVPADVEPPPDRPPIADAGALDHAAIPGDGGPGNDVDLTADEAGAPDSGAADLGPTPPDAAADVAVADAVADVLADVLADLGRSDTGGPDGGGCSAGLARCGDACVDLGGDARHCGTCGHACGEVEACTGGTCTATCAAPRMLCGSGADTRCVDVQADAANCGRCGMACATGNACSAGVCAAATCMTTASNCDANTANGCEVLHGTALNTCPAAESLGAFCGDTACGLFCPSRSLQTVATRTGNRSRWFRGRLNQCSSCPAALNATLTLTVPAGVDYDLYVYSACGRLLGSSQALAGATETFTLTGGGTPGDDSQDFYVEVRWYSGASCMPWTLTFRARSNSATSC